MNNMDMVQIIATAVASALLAVGCYLCLKRKPAPTREAMLEQRRQQRQAQRQEHRRRLGLPEYDVPRQHQDGSPLTEEEEQILQQHTEQLKAYVISMLDQYRVQKMVEDEDFIEPTVSGQDKAEETQKDIESGEPSGCSHHATATITTENDEINNESSSKIEVVDTAASVALSSSAASHASQLLVHLPNRTLPQPSEVENCCAICLSEYEAGEVVTWAANPRCQHAFHQDCIVDYLALQLRKLEYGDIPWLETIGESEQQQQQKGAPIPSCPCCRQDFWIPKESHREFAGIPLTTTNITEPESFDGSNGISSSSSSSGGRASSPQAGGSVRRNNFWG